MLRAMRNLREDGHHLAKFTLVSTYTDTGKSAVLALRNDMPSPRSWIDTERSVLYRQANRQEPDKQASAAMESPRKTGVTGAKQGCST